MIPDRANGSMDSLGGSAPEKISLPAFARDSRRFTRRFQGIKLGPMEFGYMGLILDPRQGSSPKVEAPGLWV